MKSVNFSHRAQRVIFSLMAALLLLLPVSANAHDNQPPAIHAIPDQAIEVGDIRRLPVTANDPDGNDGLRLTLLSAPAYVMLIDNGNGNGVVVIAPSCQETMGGMVTLQANDANGTATQISFNITVLPNRDPKINIPTFPFLRCDMPVLFRVVEPGGGPVKVTSNSQFVKVIEDGMGGIFIEIFIPCSDGVQGGRLDLTFTDPCGLSVTTSFNFTVMREVILNAATFRKPNLFIVGMGFANAGNRVLINGADVSARIRAESTTAITLKGSRKKLNLRAGINQIVVIAGGVTSKPLILRLDD